MNPLKDLFLQSKGNNPVGVAVFGIVSISPLPTEGTVSPLRLPLKFGKMLLTRNLHNIYTWERQFLSLTGSSQFTAIEQWSYLLGSASSLFSTL